MLINCCWVRLNGTLLKFLGDFVTVECSRSICIPAAHIWDINSCILKPTMRNARKWTKWINKIGFLHPNQYQNIVQLNGGRSWAHEWTLTGNGKRQQSVRPWGDHYSVSFKPITAITEFSISLLICLRSTLNCSPGGCRDGVCVNTEAIVPKHSDSFVLAPYCSTNAIMAVRLKRWLSAFIWECLPPRWRIVNPPSRMRRATGPAARQIWM